MLLGRSDQSKVVRSPAHGAVRGALLGFVCVAAGVAVLASSSGSDLPSAVLMGLFVGSWGGCGFGAMLGGTVAFVRAEERERAAATIDRDVS